MIDEYEVSFYIKKTANSFEDEPLTLRKTVDGMIQAFFYHVDFELNAI